MQRDDDTMVFRSLTDADLPLLYEWMQRPHVTEWWDAPASFDECCHEYSARSLELAGVKAFIACLDDRPVGFIQSYVARDAGDGWWADITDPGVRGIDQFLAEADMLNRGMGTTMVRAFVETMFADPTVTRIQTDPAPGNVRAIRCFEKAGFRRVGEVTTPDGLAIYMLCDRPL